MNKKQRKTRIKYLKQLQKGPDPKEIRKRKMLGLLLSQDKGKCFDCVYRISQYQKPRSTKQISYCCHPHKTKDKGRCPTIDLITLSKTHISVQCVQYKPLN
jgi:hypothetical protein